MAVTLTRVELAVELRIIADAADAIQAGQAAVLDRLLAAATASVAEYAPDAPDALANEAVVRLAGRLYDLSGAQSRGGNPFVASGAAALLSRHRARSVRAAGTATPSGTAGLDTAGVDARIADWAEEGNSDPIPVEKLSEAGGAATDQVARDAAAAAGTEAAAAQTAADAAQVTADSKVTAAGARAEVADFARATNPTGHLPAERLGQFPAADIAAIPNGGSQRFVYEATAQRSQDGATVAYIGGGWKLPAEAGGGLSAPVELATENLGDLGNQARYETSWRLPAEAGDRAIQLEVEGADPQFTSAILWSGRLRTLAADPSGDLTEANSIPVLAYTAGGAAGVVRVGRDSVGRLLLDPSTFGVQQWNATLRILGW